MLLELAPSAGGDGAMLGGKGIGLLTATRLGVRVPPTVVLPAPSVPQPGAARQRWMHDAAQEIVDWAAQRSVTHLAIRSSAVVEDLDGNSYAGIFSSSFALLNATSIAAALSKVLDSARSSRRTAYERAAGIQAAHDDSDDMAVVIQATVPPRCSGVAFAWGQPDDFRLRAQGTWGLAVNVVAGVTHADVLEVRPARSVSRTSVGAKALAVYPCDDPYSFRPGDFVAVPGVGEAKLVYVDDEEGLAFVRQPDDHAGASCLGPALVDDLVAVAQSCSAAHVSGVDIEWVQDVHGRLWVVQLRPMTAPLPEIQEEQGERSGPPINLAPDQGVVTGEPGAPGRAYGLAASAETFDESDNGQPRILVCGAARPELLPAVAVSAAVVSSDAGLLCHIAILARELGKPCVIGIHDAPRRFRDGTMLSVDGTTGVVRTGAARDVAQEGAAAVPAVAGPACVTYITIDDLDDPAFAELDKSTGPTILVVTSKVDQVLRDKSDVIGRLTSLPQLCLVFTATRWQRWRERPPAHWPLEWDSAARVQDLFLVPTALLDAATLALLTAELEAANRAI